MTRASPIIASVNSGELSPTLDGRVDLAKYFSGCKRLENFLPLVQGPGTRRGGTRFVKATKNEAHRSWLLKFEYNATDFFVLEFGDLYVRFYTDHGYLETGTVAAWSGATAYTLGNLASRLGVNYYCILGHTNQQPPNATYWYALTTDIYEIPSPYALADLTNADGSCALKVVQSGDVLYIANMYRTYATRKLTRFADTTWAFSLYTSDLGPFLEQNSGVITLIADAATGNVTLTASAALFVATDVGRLVRLAPQSFDTRPWETALAYAANDLVRFDGKTYKALNSATTGSVPPTHLEGNAYDGKTGVQWAYQNAGYGILKITAVTDSTHADADVIVDTVHGLNLLPAEVVATASLRWQLGAWSATTEYPSVLAFFRKRLCLAGKLRLWLSVPEDFESHAADFYDEQRFDNAFTRIVTGQDVNDIQWMVGADKLLIGTGGGEFVGGEITTSEPLGPANFEIVPQSGRRARSVQPCVVGAAVCYLQRAGRKLLSLNYAFERDRYTSTDLAVLAERITRSGVIDMAYQSEPFSIIWSVLSNGGLRGFTTDAEQDVQGWHRHPIGGTGVIVESVVCGPTPDGGREEGWFQIRRTINGATHRYIEFMERPWEGDDEDGTPGDDQEDAFYVDSGLTYDGAPTTAISGLNHLEGQTVQILADGARQPDKVVTGGAITLDRAASVVQAGLQFVSRLVPMRLEAGSQDGTAQGKIGRIEKVTVRFLDTLGGKIGRYGQPLDSISLRSPSTPMGQPPPFTSGDQVVPFDSDYDTDALIEIVQDGPLPMTVVAIMPRMRKNS